MTKLGLRIVVKKALCKKNSWRLLLDASVFLGVRRCSGRWKCLGVSRCCVGREQCSQVSGMFRTCRTFRTFRTMFRTFLDMLAILKLAAGENDHPGFDQPCCCSPACRRRFFFGENGHPGFDKPCCCYPACRRRFFSVKMATRDSKRSEQSGPKHVPNVPNVPHVPNVPNTNNVPVQHSVYLKG